MSRQILIIFLLLSSIACSVDKIDLQNQFGVEYYPLQTGNYRIYDVDQTIYELGMPSPANFQLKETVVDSFVNQGGGYTYTLHREIWDEIQETWNLTDSWSARLSDTEAVLAEGNTHYLKLAFPLSPNKTWDGNAYNTMDEEIYEADSIDLVFTVAEQDIQNTVTIVQSNNLDKIVETDYRIEKYAPGIGLIYKEITNLEYCTSNDSCLGQQIIESGLIYKQSIIAFGNE